MRPKISARSRLGRCAPAEGERLLITAAMSDGDRAGSAWSAWVASRDLSDSNWRTSALLPALLDRVPAESLGTDRATVKQLRIQNWVLVRLRLAKLGRLLEAASTVTPNLMVFKGAALAAAVYPPGARTMADADIAVRHEHFEDVIDHLARSGWMVKETTRGNDWVRALTMVDAEGFEFDVHRWVLYPRYTRMDEDGIWLRAQRAQFGGVDALVPSDADSIVIAILHGLTPSDAGAVRWPLDVALLAERAGDSVWSRVEGAALELGVGRLVAAGLNFLVEDFEFVVPAELIARMEAQPLDRLLAAEWWLRRRGIGRGSRARWYRDGCRAVGVRPSPQGYVRMRWQKLRSSDGVFEIAERRWDGAVAYWRERRDRQTRW